ncbi:tetratricopeptide repeat protein [Streptomyces kanamyceticus]|uniref:tetratricopeptide repeat protein n=1 Tax=Streptomyces kanamyceticus TaxID=1967 RepID=UPI000B25F6B0|nr:hypothetical protein [Streptomyces kanamyceticus]
MLEHRYGAILLGHLLTGDPLTELGDDVTPRRITFQASSFSPVDDVVVIGNSANEIEHRVSIGVRRDPSFVASNKSTVDLIGSYLRTLHQHLTEITAGTWKLALVVASPNSHIRQMQELAAIARDVGDDLEFRKEVDRPGRTTRAVRERLRQFDQVVAIASNNIDITFDATPVSEVTWRLLGALRLREIRLEGTDETDRTQAVGRLRQITGDGTPATADRLFSRLCELAGRYAPAAATKDELSLLRDLKGFSLSISNSSSARHTKSQVDEERDHAAAHSDPPVRSNYLSQVRRIAPVRLLGRKEELEFLSEFCKAPNLNNYLWWRAKAWAGKSALLSWFTLNPPDGVHIVSFFITARLAGQADRVAFSDVVLEQLLEILGEPMPPLLTDSTRDAHLLGSLDRAARICRQKGKRLVLIVDGLDEDQGVTAGPDAHSIAATLPSDPPANMRVIVASRPSPPIPADVPGNHPLRQRVTVRSLRDSPHAEVVRQDAERELKRLFHGTTTELDLLGLLTAAGGGLSEADLAELTGLSPWEINSYLSAVSGRTFTSQSGRLQRNTVYMLGHEELQQQAANFLGKLRLDSYRQRLYNWSDEYSRRRWPSNTPEYLLRGYFKLLQATGDQVRMLTCATDPDRHDRMLDIIGGDTSALAEIVTTQEIIANQADPDLSAVSRLAIHRARLSTRNDNIPANLPSVWVQLGRFNRAEALARSITAPFRRVQALTAVARDMAAAGDLSLARLVISQAEQALEEITDEYEYAHATAVVARAAAGAGDPQRAGDLISRAEMASSSLTDPHRRAHVTVAIARAAASMGHVQSANRTAQGIPTWSERAQALLAVATELANIGDVKSSRRIAHSIRSRSERSQALSAVARAESSRGNKRAAIKTNELAEATARAIRNPSRQSWTLVSVAHAAMDIGQDKMAAALLESALRLAETIGRSSDREDVLTSIARVTAIAKNPDHAARIARKVASPARRVKSLAALASGLASAGYENQAEKIAIEAEIAGRSITSPSQAIKGLAELSQATAAAGDVDQAEQIAQEIPNRPQRERTLTVVAEAMARTGNLNRAIDIAASFTDELQQDKTLSLIAAAAATTGKFEQAKTIAQLINDPTIRARTLATLLRIESGTDKRSSDQTVRVDASAHHRFPQEVRLELNSGDFAAAEAVAVAIDHPYHQYNALLAIACELAAIRGFERAKTCVGFISNVPLRAKALAHVGEVLTEKGETSTAKQFFNQAITVANTITTAYRDQLLVDVSQRIASAGYTEWAESIVRSIKRSAIQQKALSSIAVSVATSGEIDQAQNIAISIPESRVKARALTAIVRSGISAGELDKAEMIARLITNPISQGQALSAVTEAFASSGRPEHAEEVAHSINHLPEQARALASLASRLAATESRRILAQALTVGHWQICLPVLARLEPSVVSVMAEEFLRTTRQPPDERGFNN